MEWYDGPTVLQMLDNFEKERSRADKPFRFPVQDIYKFTAEKDDRRIIAGRIETGSINVGDEVVFLPSEKRTRIASIQGFNMSPQQTAIAGYSTGFTLEQQIYITPGELMCKTSEQTATVGTQLKVNIFWMGRQPMIKGKRYKMKLAGTRIAVWLRDVVNVLDASDLTTDSNKQQIERHDVAECILETLKPVAFDTSVQVEQTGRFVIIDNFEIAGGGVVLEKLVSQTSRIQEGVHRREQNWNRSGITSEMRAGRYNQRSTLVLLCGPARSGKKRLAKALEEDLFSSGRFVYYLGVSDQLPGSEVGSESSDRDEYLRQLGEISHMFTDAGMILITTISDLDDYELEMVEVLNKPNDCLVINVGENLFNKRKVDLEIDQWEGDIETVSQIKRVLARKNYLIEYYL
jgi:bifunctional enzyme CysN/CysC